MKQAIIKTAARLIKSDIKSNVMKEHPSSTLLSTDSALCFLPDTSDIVELSFCGRKDHVLF